MEKIKNEGMSIAGVTSGAGGALAPLAEILGSLEEQKVYIIMSGDTDAAASRIFSFKSASICRNRIIE